MNVGDARVSAVDGMDETFQECPETAVHHRQSPAGRRGHSGVAAQSVEQLTSWEECVGDGRFKSPVIQTRIDSVNFSPSRSFKEKEVAACVLHAFADLAEKVRLARSCRTLDNHPRGLAAAPPICASPNDRSVSSMTGVVQAIDMHRPAAPRCRRGWSPNPASTDPWSARGGSGIHSALGIAKRWQSWLTRDYGGAIIVGESDDLLPSLARRRHLVCAAGRPGCHRIWVLATSS